MSNIIPVNMLITRYRKNYLNESNRSGGCRGFVESPWKGSCLSAFLLPHSCVSRHALMSTLTYCFFPPSCVCKADSKNFPEVLASRAKEGWEISKLTWDLTGTDSWQSKSCDSRDHTLFCIQGCPWTVLLIGSYPRSASIFLSFLHTTHRIDV